MSCVCQLHKQADPGLTWQAQEDLAALKEASERRRAASALKMRQLTVLLHGMQSL